MNGQAFAVSATSLVGQSLGKKRADMANLYDNTLKKNGNCSFYYTYDFILCIPKRNNITLQP